MFTNDFIHNNNIYFAFVYIKNLTSPDFYINIILVDAISRRNHAMSASDRPSPIHYLNAVLDYWEAHGPVLSGEDLEQQPCRDSTTPNKDNQTLAPH